MRSLANLVAVILGLLLIWSGWIHFQNPYEFFESIVDYTIVRRTEAAVLASIMPGVMLVTGAGLVFGFWKSASNCLGSSLFILFATVQATALVRGLEISCGCFGPNSHQVSGMNVILWGAAGLFLIHYEFFSSDFRSTVKDAAISPSGSNDVVL
jgi:uncharacterized membrane protein